MPVTLSYPGIYIEEIPSGVHTIAGVSTANTAFVDVFARGQTNQAIQINSFADFERTFGGLASGSEASYAIQQYYLNGGQVAFVVRVPAGNPQTAQHILQEGSPAQHTLTVAAASPGAWGNNVQVAVMQGPPPAAGQPPTTFNLFVREVVQTNGRQRVVNSEVYRNLNMTQGDPRYAVSVVNTASALVQLTDDGTGKIPTGVPFNPSGAPPADADFQALGDAVSGTDSGTPSSADVLGDPALKTGIYALDAIEPAIFNLLCLPAAAALDANGFTTLISAATAYCESKRAFLIVDIPSGVTNTQQMLNWMVANDGLRQQYAAVYFPRLVIPDVLNQNRPRNVGASGTVAGVYARTDATRGVWKAPAGTGAVLQGASLATTLSDLENGTLNPLGINVLRTFPIFGPVVWGARTLEGADQMTSDWKYIPVRRTASYIEESLFQGLKWVVFEPNDEPLWAQIRLNVGAFMQDLFRQGAFQGTSPRDAYFVKCDKDTTTQTDINNGIVNILVGFAPLKPAEFVVLQIQQMAGQIQS